MTTTVNNTIENANVVANNEGYNANVTNEVIVLNGDTFYRKNMVEGQKYRYGSHYFVIDKFEMRGTHLYYCGTLDNKPFEGDLHSLKVACECTERRQKNGSANDTENGKAVKVKRTSKETADQIKAKYADTVKTITEKVGKLQEDARITAALNLLCTMVETVAAERIETITNAEQAKRAARLQRLQDIAGEIEAQTKVIDDLVQRKKYVEIGMHSNIIKNLEAEQLLLQQEENAYLASLAPTSEDAEGETTEAEETEDNK